MFDTWTKREFASFWKLTEEQVRYAIEQSFSEGRDGVFGFPGMGMFKAHKEKGIWQIEAIDAKDLKPPDRAIRRRNAASTVKDTEEQQEFETLQDDAEGLPLSVNMPRELLARHKLIADIQATRERTALFQSEVRQKQAADDMTCVGMVLGQMKRRIVSMRAGADIINALDVILSDAIADIKGYMLEKMKGGEYSIEELSLDYERMCVEREHNAALNAGGNE